MEIQLRDSASAFRAQWSQSRSEGLNCYRPSSEPGLIYKMSPSSRCGLYNQQGFRDNPFQLEKVAGTFRIIVIGDSVAGGEGIDDIQLTFPKLLERKLNSNSKRKIEVLNMAVTGYSTSQELVLLEKTALAYKPDLVLWSYCLNDPAHPVFHHANANRGRFFVRPTSYFLSWLEEKVYRVRENLKVALCEHRDKIPYGPNPRIDFHTVLHCSQKDQTARQFKKFAGLLSDRKIPALFLIHPVHHGDKFGSYPLTFIHDFLKEQARAQKMTVLDSLELFGDIESASVSRDIWHLNRAGHVKVAEGLFKLFKERRLIK